MRFVKELLLTCSLLAGLMSCRQRGEWQKIKDAETNIETRPELALEILEDVHPETFRMASRRAKHALLYAIALNKNYMDTTDVDIIQPALDHYAHHGNLYDKMRTSFHHGIILSNAGRFSEAIIPLSEAEDMATRLRDSLYLGRIWSVQVYVFDCEHNSIEQLKVAQKAATCFENGRPADCARARHNLALAYTRNADYLNANACYREAAGRFLDMQDTINTALCVKALAVNLVLMPNPDPRQALRFFAEAENRFNATFLPSELAAIAYAYILTGEYGKANLLLSGIDRESVPLPILSAISYCRGDYQTSCDLLVKDAALIHDQYRQALGNSTTEVMRRHWHDEAELAKTKGRYTRSLLLVCILLMIAMILLVVQSYLYMKRRNEELVEKVIIIGERAEKAIADLRSQVEAHAKEAVRHKGARFVNPLVILCKKYIESAPDARRQNAILDEITSFVKDFQERKSSDVERVINAELDNLMLKIRRDMSNFTEEDFRIVTYMIMGFDTDMMCTLTRCTKQQIYTRTHRLRNRRKKDTPNHDRYVMIFS